MASRPCLINMNFDGDHIALVFDDADGPGGADAVLAHRVLHGPVVDMVLAQENVSETLSDPDRTHWALTDHLGSVRRIVDSAMGSPSVVGEADYDAFGAVQDPSANTTDFLFGYTGREVDEESDLNYYRARYYDPELGRFISKDPIGFAAGDANQYRYVGNGPTNATDPSGLEKVKNPYPVGSEAYFRWRDEHGGGPLRAAGTAELHSTNQWAYKDIQPTLVTIQDVSADALLLGLKNNYEIVSGHNPVRDCEVSSGQRAVQAGLTYGIPIFGAALSKSRWVTGFFSKADDVASAMRGIRVTLADAFMMGRRGGNVVTEGALDALSFRLIRNRVNLVRNADAELKALGAGGLFRVYKDGSAAIFLRRNATVYEVAHELRHYQQYLDIGPDAYRRLTQLQREQYVYDSLRNSHGWCQLSEEEIKHARDYIIRVGGNPW
jgi:RHS repeat-associated protein